MLKELAPALDILQKIPWEAPREELIGSLTEAGFAPKASSVAVRHDALWRGIDASLYFLGTDQNFLYFEIYFELVEDKEDYEALEARYAQLFGQACEIVGQRLGPPTFSGGPDDESYPEESLGIQTACWNLGPVALRVETRDDGPDVPSWLGVVVQR